MERAVLSRTIRKEAIVFSSAITFSLVVEFVHKRFLSCHKLLLLKQLVSQHTRIARIVPHEARKWVKLGRRAGDDEQLSCAAWQPMNNGMKVVFRIPHFAYIIISFVHLHSGFLAAVSHVWNHYLRQAAGSSL
jgi:hypothetical protein